MPKKAASKTRHAPVQLWKKYKDGKFSGRWCPRCGAGTILSEHKDRVYCGKCKYAEIRVKK